MLSRLAFFCVVLFPCAAAGQDWPQWGGHDDKNMVSSAQGIPEKFVPGEKRSDGTGIDLKTAQNVLWTARLGTQTYSTPTVAGGRVYIGTNDQTLDDSRYEDTGGGLLLCLDEQKGKCLWRLPVRRLESSAKGRKYHNQLQLGICSSPTIEGDRVYVVSNRGEVLCLDARGLQNGNDGTFRDEAHYTRGESAPPVQLGSGDPDILWRYDMLRELSIFPHDAISSAILLHGDLLYVCTGNGVDNDCTPFPLAPSVVALDKRTGRLVGYDQAGVGKRVFHGQWSSPSLARVGDRTLIFYGGGDGICYAFEALEKVPEQTAILKTAWSCDCNPPEYRVRNGRTIDYWDGDTRRSEANRNDGKFVGPSEIIATPVFHEGRIYVAIGQDPMHGRGRGMLTCIDATKTGDISKAGKIWTFDKIERSLSTVAIADGLLYVCDCPGRLYCLDPRTGTCHWTYDMRQETWASPLVVDGKVLVGTNKALWVFAAGKTPRVLNRIRLGSPIWCSPAVANGVLYVASQRYLWAVKDLQSRKSVVTASAARP